MSGGHLDGTGATGGRGSTAAWFETVSVEQIHDGYSRVRIEMVRTPDGGEVEREVVDHDDAVAVVALTPRDEVVLLRQYRQPLRSYVLEIPAGTMDVEGEEAEATAHRELAEEARHRADRLELLTTFHNSAGWSTERTHVFLARLAVPAPLPEGFEPAAEEADMEIVLLDLGAALDQVLEGSITDAKTVVGVLLAARRLGH